MADEAPANADTATQTTTTTQATTEAAQTRYAIEADLAKNPGMAKFLDDKGMVDINVLGKGYLHAQSMIGADKLIIPKEGDEKGWSDVFNKLGRPEKADDYKFNRPEKLPEGLPYDEDAEKWFRAEAHAQGLSQRAAAQLFDKFLQRQVDAFTSYANNYKSEMEAGQNALKKEWGAGYDGQMGLAKAAAREMGGDDLVNFLNESGVGNNPVIVKAFARVGRELMGSGKIQTNGKSTQTPADLDGEIADFTQKHKSALTDSNHIDHRVRLAEYTRLFQKRYPQEAV